MKPKMIMHDAMESDEEISTCSKKSRKCSDGKSGVEIKSEPDCEVDHLPCLSSDVMQQQYCHIADGDSVKQEPQEVCCGNSDLSEDDESDDCDQFVYLPAPESSFPFRPEENTKDADGRLNMSIKVEPAESLNYIEVQPPQHEDSPCRPFEKPQGRGPRPVQLQLGDPATCSPGSQNLSAQESSPTPMQHVNSPACTQDGLDSPLPGLSHDTKCKSEPISGCTGNQVIHQCHCKECRDGMVFGKEPDEGNQKESHGCTSANDQTANVRRSEGTGSPQNLVCRGCQVSFTPAGLLKHMYEVHQYCYIFPPYGAQEQRQLTVKPDLWAVRLSGSRWPISECQVCKAKIEANMMLYHMLLVHNFQLHCPCVDVCQYTCTSVNHLVNHTNHEHPRTFRYKAILPLLKRNLAGKSMGSKPQTTLLIIGNINQGCQSNVNTQVVQGSTYQPYQQDSPCKVAIPPLKENKIGETMGTESQTGLHGLTATLQRNTDRDCKSNANPEGIQDSTNQVDPVKRGLKRKRSERQDTSSSKGLKTPRRANKSTAEARELESNANKKDGTLEKNVQRRSCKLQGESCTEGKCSYAGNRKAHVPSHLTKPSTTEHSPTTSSVVKQKGKIHPSKRKPNGRSKKQRSKSMKCSSAVFERQVSSKCPDCCLKLAFLEKLREHMFQCHNYIFLQDTNKVVAIPMTFLEKSVPPKCIDCAKVLGTRTHIVAHMIISHSYQYVCPFEHLCKSQFRTATISELLGHLKVAHRDRKNDSVLAILQNKFKVSTRAQQTTEDSHQMVKIGAVNLKSPRTKNLKNQPLTEEQGANSASTMHISFTGNTAIKCPHCKVAQYFHNLKFKQHMCETHKFLFLKPPKCGLSCPKVVGMAMGKPKQLRMSKCTECSRVMRRTCSSLMIKHLLKLHRYLFVCPYEDNFTCTSIRGLQEHVFRLHKTTIISNEWVQLLS